MNSENEKMETPGKLWGNSERVLVVTLEISETDLLNLGFQDVIRDAEFVENGDVVGWRGNTMGKWRWNQ